eukprot:374342_1
MTSDPSFFEILRDFSAVGKIMREAATQELVTSAISEQVIKGLIVAALSGSPGGGGGGGGGSPTSPKGPILLQAQQQRLFLRCMYQLKNTTSVEGGKTTPSSENGAVAKKLEMEEAAGRSTSPKSGTGRGLAGSASPVLIDVEEDET